MTDRPSSGRSLPPLSQRSLPKEPPDSDRELPKPKKKKTAGARSDTESPRRRRRTQSAAEESDGVASPAEAEGTTRPRRKRKTPRTDDEQTNGHAPTIDDESTPTADTLGSGSTVSKTKKKKKKDMVGTSRETLMNTGEDEETARPKKKKKKKKTGSQAALDDEVPEYDLGLAAELRNIKDDVVDADGSRDERESIKMSAPAMRSEPLGTVFIERKNGFKAADKVKLARRMEEAQMKMAQLPSELPSQTTTIQFGLSTHKVFKTFTLFCHGLFAGFAFWHIVMVFTLIDSTTTDAFLEYYYRLAQPVQSLYFILFVLCTVSVFDRYDLSCVNRRFLVRALTLQNGTVACLFYFVGLVVSLSIAATDDKISLFKLFADLWSNKEVAASELNTWRILNLVRGVTAILGWIIISLRPNTDRLVKNLQKAEVNAIGDELNMGITSAA